MKRRIYKYVSVILVIAVLLAGCGSENETDNADAGKAGSTGEAATSEAAEASDDKPETDAESAGDATLEGSSENVVTDTSDTNPGADSGTDKEDTKLLYLTAINLTGIDIGMFSVIDPATGEQANIGGLKSNERYTFECNWPKDTKEFKWALYNMDGELCIEATTDISKAEQAAFLIMLGKDSVQDVKVYYDDEIESVDLAELIKPYE
ncbi:MAG: hypothetical protein PUC13_04245 [Lachnospiraceae bacterium]|nr:hypothetical protein [Lachnospiraceae bacterium]